MKPSKKKKRYAEDEEGREDAQDEVNFEAAWSHVDRWRPSRLDQLSARASGSGGFTYYNPVAAASARPALPAHPRPPLKSGNDSWQRQRQERVPRAEHARRAHEEEKAYSDQGQAFSNRTGGLSQQPGPASSGMYRHRASRHQSLESVKRRHAPTNLAREVGFPLTLVILFIGALVSFPFLMSEHRAHAVAAKAGHEVHAAFSGAASMGQARNEPQRKWLQQHAAQMKQQQGAKGGHRQPAPPSPPSPPRARLDAAIHVSCTWRLD